MSQDNRSQCKAFRMNQAPEFIRVKRRRDEDAIDALLFEEEQLKKKRSKFVFKLTKTVNQGVYTNEKEKFSPLLKLSDADQTHRHFVLEQSGTDISEKVEIDDSSNDPSKKDKLFLSSASPTTGPSQNNAELEEDKGQLPADIAKMVDDYLKLNESSNTTETARRQKKPSRKHFATNIAKLPSLDYVYDIYHLEKIPENEEVSYSNQNIGFIKVLKKDMDLVPDEDTDNEKQLSDDEDSNDENYYQNDYPEDEDDDRSILFGSENDEFALNDVDDLQWSRLPEVSEKELNDHSRFDPDLNVGNDEYDQLFNKLEGEVDIINTLKNANIINLDPTGLEADEADEADDLDEMYDDDHYEGYSEKPQTEYERHQFFESDIDNPLAQYRDRIFGELENMINDKNPKGEN